MNPQLLEAATGCSSSLAARYAAPLDRAMTRYGIKTPKQQAAFIGQLYVESAHFTRVEENLYYTTAARLCAVWGNRFPTISSATPYLKNPRALAEKAYGGRMGNTAPGDGYLYRGRGLIQCTGKENYARFAAATGIDVVSKPDRLLEPETAAINAAWYWNDKGLNPLAEGLQWTAITRKINGGERELAERIAASNRALKVLQAV